MIDLPRAYEEEMRRLLGEEEYSRYMETFRQPVLQGLRFHSGKLTKEKWESMNPFETERIPWISNGYYMKEDQGKREGLGPSRHPYYYAGLYYLQEPSAMTPASRLPVEPGERVLDMCAAPGGKATELGARLQGRGILVANDISSSRARALVKNLELTGLANFYVASEEPETLGKKLPEFFHKVLIDAPCSGEGMFHKEPKMARYWEEKPPAYYAQIQKRLILQGADLLMPGGMLLYSTCTFSQLENEEVIAWLLKERPDMEVIEAAPYQGFAPGFSLVGEEEEINRQLSRCIRIFPQRMKGEGHFAALLKKKGEKKENCRTFRISGTGQGTGRKQDSGIPPCVWEFLEQTSLDLSRGWFQTEKDRVYFLPEGPRLPKLRYLRTGLYLGDIKKNRFEPSQALAMALSPETFCSSISLSCKDVRTLKYLKGETIEVSDLAGVQQKGWVLVCVEGYALGFGKLSRGILKNKYYAGWRMT